MRLWFFLWRIFVLFLCVVLLSQSAFIPKSTTDRVRQFTSNIEFNYFSWTVDSLFLKVGESGIQISDHLTEEVQHRVVNHYFDLVKQLEEVEAKIQQIYSDASVTDPAQAASVELNQQQELQRLLDQLAPVAEEILQSQVTTVLTENGITLGGQPIPSVLFHTTPLPEALIVSPRDTIEQDANVSLLADLSLQQITQLEDAVEKNLDISALVVDVGGIGVYPTMVMRSSDANWVIGTIAHEWTHNFLTLRPLGLNYETDNNLRTMNETTASIVGTEISQKVIARYYPEYQSSSFLPEQDLGSLADSAGSAATFDFNSEMHTTRVTVDELLKQGKVKQAEDYMEQRRQVFVEHGYLIRKLNQAYFAFYGAYAETPGGAAGEDPVGPAVRALRAQSSSLADFLNRISWMTSFSQLQEAVK